MTFKYAVPLSEDSIHIQMAGYLDICLRVGVLAEWFHIPNEGKRGIQTAIKLKRMGLRKGASDLVLIFSSHAGRPLVAMPEVKRVGKSAEKDQAAFHARVEQAGVPSGVVHSLDELRDFMRRCLELWDRQEIIKLLPNVM